MDPLYDTKQAAEFYGLAENTLAKWRCNGGGPRFVRVGPSGRAIRYRKSDLDAFLRSAASTSETAA